MRKPHVRIAHNLGPMERLIEKSGKYERWEAAEYRTGKWRRYWRRNGSIPKWAIR